MGESVVDDDMHLPLGSVPPSLIVGSTVSAGTSTTVGRVVATVDVVGTLVSESLK